MAVRTQLLLVIAGAALVGGLMFFLMVLPKRKEVAALDKVVEQSEGKLAEYRMRFNGIQQVPDNWRPRLKSRIDTFDGTFENVNEHPFANNELIRATYIKDKIYRLMRRVTRAPDFGAPLFDFGLVGESFADLHRPQDDLETIEFTLLGVGDQNLVGLVLERIERDAIPPPPPGVAVEKLKPELARVVEYQVKHLEDGKVSLQVRVEMVIGTRMGT